MYRFIHSWRGMEIILDQYSKFNAITFLAKKYYKDGKPKAHKNYLSALNQLIVPHSKNVFFNYIEKSRLYPNIRCQISLVWESSHPVSFAMTMAKDSPYFPIMNSVWLRRIEAGIRSKIQENGYNKRFNTCPKSTTGTPLGPSTVVGIFFVLVLGMVASVIILAVEIMNRACLRMLDKQCYLYMERTVVESYMPSVDNASDAEKSISKFCLK